MEAFIEDGYTRTVKVNELKGLHPACVFTYRPFTGPEAVNAEKSVLREKDGPDRVAKGLDVIAGRIDSWDLTRGGEPTEPTPDLLRLLHSTLFTRIQQIVFGYGAPDEDLTGNPPTSDQDQEGNDLGNS